MGLAGRGGESLREGKKKRKASKSKQKVAGGNSGAFDLLESLPKRGVIEMSQALDVYFVDSVPTQFSVLSKVGKLSVGQVVVLCNHAASIQAMFQVTTLDPLSLVLVEQKSVVFKINCTFESVGLKVPVLMSDAYAKVKDTLDLPGTFVGELAVSFSSDRVVTRTDAVDLSNTEEEFGDEDLPGISSSSKESPATHLSVQTNMRELRGLITLMGRSAVISMVGPAMNTEKRFVQTELIALLDPDLRLLPFATNAKALRGFMSLDFVEVVFPFAVPTGVFEGIHLGFFSSRTLSDLSAVVGAVSSLARAVGGILPAERKADWAKAFQFMVETLSVHRNRLFVGNLDIAFLGEFANRMLFDLFAFLRSERAGSMNHLQLIAHAVSFLSRPDEDYFKEYQSWTMVRPKHVRSPVPGKGFGLGGAKLVGAGGASAAAAVAAVGVARVAAAGGTASAGAATRGVCHHHVLAGTHYPGAQPCTRGKNCQFLHSFKGFVKNALTPSCRAIISSMVKSYKGTDVGVVPFLNALL